MENKIDRNDLTYKIGNKKKDISDNFQKFKTIRTFTREIYSNDLSLDNALEQQIRLRMILTFFKRIWTIKRTSQKKQQKNTNT